MILKYPPVHCHHKAARWPQGCSIQLGQTTHLRILILSLVCLHQTRHQVTKVDTAIHLTSQLEDVRYCFTFGSVFCCTESLFNKKNHCSYIKSYTHPNRRQFGKSEATTTKKVRLKFSFHIFTSFVKSIHPATYSGHKNKSRVTK